VFDDEHHRVTITQRESHLCMLTCRNSIARFDSNRIDHDTDIEHIEERPLFLIGESETSLSDAIRDSLDRCELFPYGILASLFFAKLF
jgi:hypothetical protein